jgi:DNA-binding LacI/PurR family transcriptional regulator
VRQLRERFGVSQTTLDAALGRLERQRVLLRRERSGVFVAPSLRERNVSLLCAPNAFQNTGASPFWPLLIERIRQQAGSGRLRLSLSLTQGFSDEDETALEFEDASLFPSWVVADAEAGKLHGALAIGLPHSCARWLEARGVPVVAFAGPADYMVQLNSPAVIALGVAELVRQGCRRIALWRTPHAGAEKHRGAERYDRAVFSGALAAHGLDPAQDGRVYQQVYENEPSSGPRRTTPTLVEAGWLTAQNCFGPDADPAGRPDGIVSTDDMLTQGALMALDRLGVAVGRDVRVTTHANLGSPTLLGWQDRLTRIEYDPGEVVSALFDVLAALLRGGEGLDRLPLVQAENLGVPAKEFVWTIQPRVIRPAAGGEGGTPPGA